VGWAPSMSMRSSGGPASFVTSKSADELRRSAAWLLRASDACWSAGRLETASVLRAKANRELAEAEQFERCATEWAPVDVSLGRGF
jgi:hypothetical protein